MATREMLLMQVRWMKPRWRWWRRRDVDFLMSWRSYVDQSATQSQVYTRYFYQCETAILYAIARYMLSPVRLYVRHTGGSVKDGW